ncbi:MAG: DegV family protein, partial [Dehalococcoidia bacterium]|nr:DegV family protein [Dehalococcoidia bacterium]
MIKLVTDSTCDIPADLIKKFAVSVVPINVLFG